MRIKIPGLSEGSINWPKESFSKTLEPPSHMHKREPEKQNILLTGSTSGIGLEILKSLLECGHSVVTHYRNPEGKKTLADLGVYGHGGNFAPLDLTYLVGRSHTPSITGFKEFVRSHYDKLDCIIINGGVSGLDWQSPYENWRNVNRWIASNILLVRAFVDLLHDYDERELRGRIVFISSAQADCEIKGAESYHRMKRQTEIFLDKNFRFPPEKYKNILAFIVRPGSVDTRMHRVDVPNSDSTELKLRTETLIKEGSLRSPRVIGETIAAMATTGFAWDSGSQSMTRPIERAERVNISDHDYETLALKLENVGSLLMAR